MCGRLFAWAVGSMIVLLVPPTARYPQYPATLSFSDFPTGFGYLAGSLRYAGHTVVSAPTNNNPRYPSARVMLEHELRMAIERHRPGLVGLGGLATDYRCLSDQIAIIRAIDPTLPIVLGGQIVSNDAEWIFDDLRPDYAVVGDGERVIVDIAAGRVERGIVRGVPGDIDALPLPDYKPFGVEYMLDHHSQDTRLLYRYPRPDARPFTLVASCGCPFSCSFCVHGHRGDRYRARSIASIMDEIRVTWAKYRYNILILLDELFAVGKDRLREFSEGVIAGRERWGWDFDWTFQTHASARLDEDTLRLAKRAGCYLFSYGLESAAPAVLASMGKRIRPEQVVEAVELARRVEIGFSANLIFGDMAETEATWAESLRFWMEHGRDNMIFLSHLAPYPGSAVFDGCVERGLIPDKKAYYEHIDEGVLNMTQIPDGVFKGLLNLTGFLERTWLFVSRAGSVRREEGRIRAICPHCGQMTVYADVEGVGMLGTACVWCNRRIRLEIT